MSIEALADAALGALHKEDLLQDCPPEVDVLDEALEPWRASQTLAAKLSAALDNEALFLHSMNDPDKLQRAKQEGFFDARRVVNKVLREGQ